MAKSTNYDDQVKGLTSRLRTEPVQLPVQKVMPIAAPQPQKEEEEQISVKVPKRLLKKLRMKGVEEERSLKELVEEALSQYLE